MFLIGPIFIGLAVWCASGLLTIATPDAVQPRLAVGAPWWVLPLAIVIAALVGPWRRRPVLAAPALLACVPWLPLPLPAFALIWTGPMAWAPIACACACAIGIAPIARIGAMLNAGDCRRAMVTAGVLTTVIGAATAWNVDGHVPAGDEPHYLVITQSLLKDHDIRIENNHRQGDYLQYFGGELAPHYVTRGKNGEIYSIHSPGLPALVLPAFAIGGYPAVKLLLLLFAGVTGSLIWRIGWRATDDVASAWFAWAAIVLTPTFLLHSFAVFPDGPGALVFAAATLWLLRLRSGSDAPGVRPMVAVSALIGLLPWLHTRFAVLAGGLGAAAVWHLVVLDSEQPLAARVRRATLFLIIPAASALAWFGFFETIYGTPNPAAPYGGAAGTRIAYIPGGLTGLLFDEQYGLFMYSPVLLASFLAVRRVSRRAKSTMVFTVSVAAAYLAAVATYWLWWAGSPANPARFAVAALPAFAIPLATVWNASSDTRRRMLMTLLVVSILIGAIAAGVHRGDLAWNMRNAEALWLEWLSPVVNLPRAWPSFFWTLDPARLSTELPFATHVVVSLAVFVGAWMAIRRLGILRQWSPSSWRAALAFWLLGSTMMAAQAGWSLTGATGLDAARSQMALVNDAGGAMEIGPLHVERSVRPEGRLVIRSEEPGRTDGPPPWLMLESVPAGRYALRITTSRPRAGQLLVTVGRAPLPILTLPVQSQNRQSATIDLPAGALGLTIAPTPDLDGITGAIDIQPLQLHREVPFARLARPFGSANVFFMDDGAFVEDRGFWVRGGQTTSILLADKSGREGTTFHLTLLNGGAANTVRIDGRGTRRDEALQPGERREIELAGADGRGVLPVSLTSPGGFRPSDKGGSDDRYLGVWVEVK